MIFAFALAMITLYLLKSYIEISKDLISLLIFHSPIYIAFSLFPDFVEKGGKGLVGHRRIFHSKKMLFIALISLPFLIYYSIISKKIFLNTANYYTLVLAGVLGYISHLFGDSLTSKLPK